MPLVQAKCTNCGANLQVDSAKDAAICEHCNSAFIVEKAISNYVIANAQINAQTVNVNAGGPTENSLVDYAESIMSNNPYEAVNKLKEALSINPESWLAWDALLNAYVTFAHKMSKPGYNEEEITRYGAYAIIHYMNERPPWVRRLYIKDGFDRAHISLYEVENAYEEALLYAPADKQEHIKRYYKEEITEAKVHAERHLAEAMNGQVYIRGDLIELIHNRGLSLPDWNKRDEVEAFEDNVDKLVKTLNSERSADFETIDFETIMKLMDLSFYLLKQPIEAECVRSNKDGDSRCYIATAAYGGYDAPQVKALRHYRDNTLVKTGAGRLFVKLYYRLSPPIALKLKHTHRINTVIRRFLDKFVAHISRY